MTHPIYIKRSVKEKLPEKAGYYIFMRSEFKDVANRFFNPQDKDDIIWLRIFDTHWLEEVPLEEYLKEINYKNK